MLGNFLLPFKTKVALKTNNAIRISEGYTQAKKIAVVFTYDDEKKRGLVNKFLDRIEEEGKEVQLLIYVPKAGKDETFDFPNFSVREMDFFGHFSSELLSEFEKNAFDYLINVDVKSNVVIENVLANSKAKCRVGRYQEDKQEFYELMIDFKENNYEQFLVQILHYIKNVRNG